MLLSLLLVWCLFFQVDSVTMKYDSSKKENQKQRAIVEMQKEEINSQKATIQTLNQLIGKLSPSGNAIPSPVSRAVER